MKNLNIILKILLIILLILAVIGVVYILFNVINTIEFKSENKSITIDNVLQSTSNILTFSSLLIAIFSLIIGIIGFLVYKNYQKTEDIKNQVKGIVNDGKDELNNFVISSVNNHVLFFSISLKEIFKNQVDIISIINNENNKKIDLSNYELIFQNLLHIIDTFNNIQNLFSVDKDRIEKALFFLQGRIDEKIILKQLYLSYIEQFLKLRQNNSNYHDLVYLAEKVKEKYLFI